ncbi:MAG: DUF222 domain-containing protein [Jatrophihabitans sp.]
MSETIQTGPAALLLGRLHALTDDLLTLDLGGDGDVEFTEAYRSLERLRRRLPAVEHRFVHDTQRRGLPVGCTSTGQYLAGLLHLDAPEAHARVRAADNLHGRVSLTGEKLPAPFGHVAAAQARGELSPEHARIITRTVFGLPESVQVEHGDQVEKDLTGYAGVLSPRETAICGQRIHAHLNPDGRAPEEQHKHREFALYLRPDGTGRASGELTAECAEKLATVLDSLSAPRPPGDGTPDPRTAGQRRHDGLLAITDMALLSGGLPRAGGITTSVILTMTTQDYLTGRGLATTGHGTLVPVQDALGWITGNSQLLLTALNSMREITHYSSIHRCHTEQQRLAIIARDQHCTGPECDAPIAFCQIHHVPDYAISGRTRVDEGVLACTWHHRELISGGWTTRITGGRVEWIPPPHVDPQRRPRTGRRPVF